MFPGVFDDPAQSSPHPSPVASPVSSPTMPALVPMDEDNAPAPTTSYDTASVYHRRSSVISTPQSIPTRLRMMRTYLLPLRTPSAMGCATSMIQLRVPGRSPSPTPLLKRLQEALRTSMWLWLGQMWASSRPCKYFGRLVSITVLTIYKILPAASARSSLLALLANATSVGPPTRLPYAISILPLQKAWLGVCRRSYNMFSACLFVPS